MRSGWWRRDDALARLLSDLIAAEGRALRLSLRLPPGPWPRDTAMQALGFDSLDRIALAGAVSGQLHMHDSGLPDSMQSEPTFGAWCDAACAALDRCCARVSFRTSGSTGAPRSCTHTLEDLQAESDQHAVLLAGGGTGIARILSAVPSHHIYGFLFTILLPQRLGVPVQDVRLLSPGAIAACSRPGDLIVAFPELWAAIARGAPSGWPPDVTGVTSTAPCPAATVQALGRAGLHRLLEVHGASETAGLGWRDDPGAPYRLFPHWQRLPGDRLRRAGSDTGIAMPDRIEWCGPRDYRVLARHDGAVQVGGVNVWPGSVREVLCRHPDVAAAAVRLMNETEGHRLKAFIVPAPHVADLDALRDALEAVAATLLTAERPRAWRFGDMLPGAALGKSADWTLE